MLLCVSNVFDAALFRAAVIFRAAFRFVITIWLISQISNIRPQLLRSNQLKFRSELCNCLHKKFLNQIKSNITPAKQTLRYSSVILANVRNSTHAHRSSFIFIILLGNLISFRNFKILHLPLLQSFRFLQQIVELI